MIWGPVCPSTWGPRAKYSAKLCAQHMGSILQFLHLQTLPYSAMSWGYQDTSLKHPARNPDYDSILDLYPGAKPDQWSHEIDQPGTWTHLISVKKHLFQLYWLVQNSIPIMAERTPRYTKANMIISEKKTTSTNMSHIHRSCLDILWFLDAYPLKTTTTTTTTTTTVTLRF